MIVNKNIGIVGSSLTAIDAIRTLSRANGYFMRVENKLEFKLNKDSTDFKITIHSRKGLLPNIRYHLEHPRIRKYEYISEEEIRNNIKENTGYLSLDFVFNKSYLETVRTKDPITYKEIKDLSIEEFCKYYFKREGIKDFRQYKQKLKDMRETEINRTPLYWKEALEDTMYTLNFHAKALNAKDMIRLKKHIMPVYNHLVMFVPYKSVEELIALYDAEVLENIELGFNSDIIDNKIAKDEDLLVYDLVINCIGQKNLNIEDFPFSDLVRHNLVSRAKIKTDSNIEELPNNFTFKDNYLLLPGLAINDSFQALDDKDRPTGLFILSIPFVRGFNPDLSGLPLLNDISKLVFTELTEI